MLTEEELRDACLLVFANKNTAYSVYAPFKRDSFVAQLLLDFYCLLNVDYSQGFFGDRQSRLI